MMSALLGCRFLGRKEEVGGIWRPPRLGQQVFFPTDDQFHRQLEGILLMIITTRAGDARGIRTHRNRRERAVT